MTSKPLFVLTEKDIEERQAAVREFDMRIAELRTQRDEVNRWLEAASLLLGRPLVIDGQAGSNGGEELTFTSFLNDMVLRHPEGVTYAQLKSAIADTPLAERFERNQNSLYTAVSRAEKRGEVRRSGERILSKDAFDKQMEEGGREDDTSSPNASEVLAEVVVDFLRGLGEVSVPDIRARAEEVPQIKEKLDRNPQYLYTVLSRMTKRGRLTRGASGYMLSEERDTETSSVDAEDVSKITGEVGASPVESQSTSGVFG